MPKSGRVPDFVMISTDATFALWSGRNKPQGYCPLQMSALLSRYFKMDAKSCSMPTPTQDKNA